MDQDKKALEAEYRSSDENSKGEPGTAESPPAYDEVVEDPPKYQVEPGSLILDGEAIYDADSPGMPLYRLSRRVTHVSHKNASIKLDRIERAAPEKAESTAPAAERRHQIFYLVHPNNARYRTDVHPYFMTAKAPGMLGNVRLDTIKSRLQKTEFRALLSAGRSAADDPLFNEGGGEKTLFSIKPKWMGGRCNWTDGQGRELAFEDGKSEKPRLVITTAMEVDMRDALVGMWCLKVWRDTMETMSAKMDQLEQQIPGDSLQDWGSSTGKRMGAAGALAGAGGGG